MAGDYIKFQRHYGPIPVDLDFSPVLSLSQTAITVRNASYRIYVQKIELYPAIYAAATLSIQDSTGYVLGIVAIPAAVPVSSAALNPLKIPCPDWGPTGTPLTLGANLVIAVTGGTPTMRVHIEAYQRLGQTISANSGAASQ